MINNSNILKLNANNIFRNKLIFLKIQEKLSSQYDDEILALKWMKYSHKSFYIFNYNRHVDLEKKLLLKCVKYEKYTLIC